MGLLRLLTEILIAAAGAGLYEGICWLVRRIRGGRPAEPDNGNHTKSQGDLRTPVARSRVMPKDSRGMGAAMLIAEATNTPVWWLVGVTSLLAGVTGVLAGAAIKALLELDEVKTDRHVQVFADFGRRWESAEMSEALQLEQHYSPVGLAELFKRAEQRRSRNPFKERRRVRDACRRTVLLRVPNYFEDAAMIAKAGGLDVDLFVENFGGVAVDEWRRWGPAIKLLQDGDPASYIEFEKLVVRSNAADAKDRPTSPS